MKVMTFGWISVFLGLLGMNLYVWNQYWQIPFVSLRLLKLTAYLLVHLALIAISIYYFYLFFTGNTNTKKSRLLSKISGFYIIFISYSLFFYGIYDLARLTSYIVRYPDWLKQLANSLFFGGFLIFTTAGFIGIMGLLNSRKIRVKEYRIKTKRKSSKLRELKIAYISDGHIGTSLNLENIDQLIGRINSLKPDLVLLGGDFFDEGTTRQEKLVLAEKLGGLKSRYGIYSIEGNHEYKSDICDIDMEMDYFKDMGIVVLQDQWVKVDNKFYLVGRKDREGESRPLKETMKGMDQNLPVILMDHRPGFKEALGSRKVDIQLSGHTHSGQFFPMNIMDFLLPRIRGEYIYGHHKIGKLHHIVSSGAGNWAIPVRVASQREILNIKVKLK